MLNSVAIMGRLGKRIELRRTQSGKAVTSFSLAVDRDTKGQDGTRETDWILVTAWDKTAEFLGQYAEKGRALIVTGRLQVRKWQDRDGAIRQAVEVIANHVYFADSKRDTGGNVPQYGGTANSYGTAPQYGNGYGVPQGQGGVADDFNEADLPF